MSKIKSTSGMFLPQMKTIVLSLVFIPTLVSTEAHAEMRSTGTSASVRKDTTGTGVNKVRMLQERGCVPPAQTFANTINNWK